MVVPYAAILDRILGICKEEPNLASAVVMQRPEAISDDVLAYETRYPGARP